MLATVVSAALQGIEAVPVQVEVNACESGDLKLVLVGLPDAAVRESGDRLFSALANSGRRLPKHRTTINLAPADTRKEGPLYDLPIALAFLAASDQIPVDSVNDHLIAGELGLSGQTRPVRGALAMAVLARKLGKRGVLLPPVSAQEAALVEGVEVRCVRSLDEATRFLTGESELAPLTTRRIAAHETAEGEGEATHDFAEIKGQHAVRRAVEVAVAGMHNLLMIGSPGCGKSMIAKRIPTVMPAPELDEFLEVMAVHSAAGRTLQGELATFSRPFRTPHHTISDVGLIGGGAIPGPGEISLAHQGVLFLDELPEFKRSVLEVMRQPLEDGQVTISRSAGKVTLPARFMLVAAMNPCPCGYLGDRQRECRCSAIQVQRYRARVSGPLLDRIDLHVEAPSLTVAELRSAKTGENSAVVRGRIETARARQRARFSGAKVRNNAEMTPGHIRRHCAIDSKLGDLLEHAMRQLALSARAYDRILKVARTIADLAGSERIEAPHLLEAIQYRSLDRSGGGPLEGRRV